MTNFLSFMDENDTQVQEEVVEQEEITTTEEVTEEETPDEDTLTLRGDDKAEYEKWKAKKEERQRFAEKAKTAPTKQPIFNITAEKLERIELRQDGYTSEEVDAIMELGGTKALSNPIVKNAIEAMRTKAKADRANQPLTSRSPVYKKFTQDDLKKMSASELEKILPRE